MNKMFLGLGAVAILALAVFGYMQSTSSGSGASVEITLDQESDVLNDIILGEESAPVTIVEYASFTCPHCANFHSTVLPELKSEFIDTGKVRLVHREVIFDAQGMMAVSAARCLPEDKYYGMLELIYKNQASWAVGKETIEEVQAELQKFMTLAGLPADSAEACFADAELQENMFTFAQARVNADGIKGTPTIFVNGKRVENWQWDNLKSEIESALN